MKKTFVIVIALFLVSCSANIVEESNVKMDYPVMQDSSSAAMEHFINGQILDTQEKYDAAAEEFNKALKYQKNSGIYYSLALDYYRLNKLAWAKQSAVKAIEGGKSNKEYIYLLASIYETAKAADSAAVCYEKILLSDSLDVRANFNLAGIYQSSKPSKSLEIYKKLLRAIGPTPEVLFEMAALNERLGNSQETIRTIEDLIALNPSDLPLKKILIETCIKAKDYEKALKLVEDLLIVYPDDFNLIGYKGGIFAEKGEWDKAKDVYLKLIQNPEVNYLTKIKIGMAFLAKAQSDSLASDAARNIFETVDKDTIDWQVKFYLAEINLARKNDTLALKYYKEASDAADWNVDIWTRYGGLIYDLGKFDLLNVEMGKAIKLFADNFVINLLYGLSFAQIDKHKEAKPYLLKAVSINPNDLMVLSALGYSLNQLKEEDAALKYLDHALNIDPNNLQVLGMAGLIYENKKNYEQSDKLYTRAISVDSTDAQILNNYAYSLSERDTDLNKALKMAKKAVEKEPKNSSYLDTIGWIYFKLGETEKALHYIAEAINCGEKSVTIYEHLGDVYAKMNNKTEALKNWKKALEIEPENAKIKLKIEKDSK